MKRKFIVAIVGLMAFSLVIGGAFAVEAPTQQKAAFVIGVKEYFFNDKTPGVKMDVAPFIENGRTYTPVRYIANAIGVKDADISWDAATGTVTMKMDGTTATLVIGKPTVVINGNPRTLDVAPSIVNDRTFLPARYVAEAFGYEVGWDAATQTVLVYRPGDVPPNSNAIMDYLDKADLVKPKPNTEGSKVPEHWSEQVPTIGGGTDTTQPTETPVRKIIK